ncbi:MAG: pilus assembly protein PilM [Phycisphaerales bacterium]
MLKFLKTTNAPIAIDFGYSEVKALQLVPGEKPTVGAAARIEIPEAARQDSIARWDFLNDRLPRALREARFRGKLAVCSIPAWQTFTQHMQVGKGDASAIEAQLLDQLQNMIACDPDSVLIRHLEICDLFRAGEALTEVVCFAVNREVVMKQLDLLGRCKLDIGGLHAEPIAMARAFDHLYRREGDDRITTLYLDLGANGAKAVIAHGREIRFVKSIPVGGRHFDQRIGDSLKISVEEARAARFERAKPPAESNATPVSATGVVAGAAAAAGSSAGVRTTEASAPVMTADERRVGQLPSDFRPLSADGGGDSIDADAANDADTIHSAISGLVEQLVDETRMCLRYHESLFPDRPVDRVILMGGEARDAEMAREVAEAVGAPAFVADPLRPSLAEPPSLVGLDRVEGQPGWCVTRGLCGCPLDR